MLDAETKRRIDTARDILVGKVPDPKSQVEQITMALIYKFMDDMDAEAEELGGVRTFFSGEYARYGWSKLMDAGIGAQATLNLYAEALEKMKENVNVPQLFRDIFKNAFLPYRDPETLKSFLKVINGFEYSHSENLGDAYEYLLSIMSSQGDAGQFRTPRHIIDFMVALVDPQKEDRILDPACGTAGFLISAYKHIMKANQNGDDGKKGMTPDERTRLMGNIEGYDISPDMVRISLVNLYLHGFNTPKIYEYDTLTSEDRWNDYADVILANPPFMSPKGGIRPHRRFSVESSRSEVLFVDYIMEHLTPNGRAAVIVPEGIIFQGGKAYKALRKTLVENDYLVGVISLPSGVFNPYSGVKTSILWIDRALAKKSDSIIFCRVEHDGFDLGAQRRANGKDDLPGIIEKILPYKTGLISDEIGIQEETENLVKINKGRLSERGEFRLNVEQYLISTQINSRYSLMELGSICDLYQPKTITKDELIEGGKYFVFGANGVIGRYDSYNHEESEVIVTCRGATCGTVNMSYPKSWITGNAMVVKPKIENLDKRFLYWVLRYANMSSSITGSAQPQITRQNLSITKIPVPSLNKQLEIVDEVETYQKIIDGARMVVENYRPRIEVDPDWPVVKLGEVCEDIKSGFAYGESEKNINGIMHIRPMNITSKGEFTTEGTKFIPIHEAENYRAYRVQKDDVLFNNTNSKELVGKTCLIEKDVQGFYSNHITRLRLKPDIAVPKFISTYLHNVWQSGYFLEICHKWVGQAGVNIDELTKTNIPLPHIVEQVNIVKSFNEEKIIIENTKKLIDLYENKIKIRIAKVWGEG